MTVSLIVSIKPLDEHASDEINRRGRLGKNRDHQQWRRHDSCSGRADRHW